MKSSEGYTPRWNKIVLIEYSKNSVTSFELPFSESLCVCALSVEEDALFFSVDDEAFFSADDDEAFFVEDDDGFRASAAADLFSAGTVDEIGILMVVDVVVAGW